MSNEDYPTVITGSLIRLKDNVYTSEESDIAADNYGHPAIFADYWYGWFEMFFCSGSLGVITKVNDMGATVYLFEKKTKWFFFHNEYQVVSKSESKKITAEIYPSASNPQKLV